MLLLLSPFILLLYVLVKSTSKGPFIFKQERVGKNKKRFTIYKIRTMVNNAEELKWKYIDLNERDGPVFKIYNDPRYTQIGKILSHLAIDEILQLLNILKGEMKFVGPRPLPVGETDKIENKYNKRFSVLPGITSLWIVKGYTANFNKWMELDIEYVEKRCFLFDSRIVLQTVAILFLNLLRIHRE